MNIYNNQDDFETLYFKSKLFLDKYSRIFSTFLIRIRKFLMLPYCYFKFVNWNECKTSRIQVIYDLLYIFFKLKYYPENYGYCRLWEKDRSEWKYYYGSNYDAYQKYKLEKEIAKKEYEIVFEDKEVCQQVCEACNLNIPKCVGFLAPDDNILGKLNEFFQTTKKNRLIVKPVRGRGGRDILLAKRNDDSIKIYRMKTELNNEKISLKERCIVQEYIEQDKELTRLTTSASIRMTTFYSKSNEILLIGGEVLTAVDSDYLSNWSAGGVTISVDLETGRLHEKGYDKNGREYRTHPSSNIVFKDYVMPRWDEIKAFAIKIQTSCPYYRMLGPDITLTKDGPILYEINATPDLSSTEQSCGPLLRNKRLLKEFNEYDLLISKAQKDLLRQSGTSAKA